jgi:hypothetical protein
MNDMTNEHDEDDIWRGEGQAPPGVWITPSGEWRILNFALTTGDEFVERNHCCCAFCQQLRRAAASKMQ